MGAPGRPVHACICAQRPLRHGESLQPLRDEHRPPAPPPPRERHYERNDPRVLPSQPGGMESTLPHSTTAPATVLEFLPVLRTRWSFRVEPVSGAGSGGSQRVARGLRRARIQTWGTLDAMFEGSPTVIGQARGEVAPLPGPAQRARTESRSRKAAGCADESDMRHFVACTRAEAQTETTDDRDNRRGIEHALDPEPDVARRRGPPNWPRDVGRSRAAEPR